MSSLDNEGRPEILSCIHMVVAAVIIMVIPNHELTTHFVRKTFSAIYVIGALICAIFHDYDER
jgi:hypothetical protein